MNRNDLTFAKTRGNRERYFQSWEYNATRIINRLAELVEEAGGTVDRHDDELLIHTRGYDERIARKKALIDSCDTYLNCLNKYKLKRVKIKHKLEQARKELAELIEKKEKAPTIRTCFVSLVSDLWIRFELDGYEYYFETEGNPFFPDKWLKKKCGSAGKYYMETIDCPDKFYCLDDMFNPVADESSVEDAARKLLDFFKACAECKSYA